MEFNVSTEKLNLDKDGKKKLGQTVMSTVYFFENTLPSIIALKDCGFPLNKPIDDSLSALYGHIGKQAGFMLAKAYADKHRLQYTIIDFNVQFDNPIDTVPVGLEQLKNAELVSLKRLPKNEITQLYNLYVNSQAQEEKKAYMKLVENPELLSKFINHPDYENLKLVIYPGITAVGDQPLTIGSIPHRHWDVITSAECRLHPNTKVTLENPVANNRVMSNERLDNTLSDRKINSHKQR